MIVGAADPPLFPGLLSGRLQMMAFGHLPHLFGCQSVQAEPDDFVGNTRPEAVDRFKNGKEQEKFFEMIRGHPAVDTDQGMSDGMGDFLPAKKSRQIKKAGTKPFDFPELPLVRIPCEQVNLASVLRKIAGDFHTREKPLPAPQLP